MALTCDFPNRRLCLSKNRYHLSLRTNGSFNDVAGEVCVIVSNKS